MNWIKKLDFQFSSDIHLEFYDANKPHKWPLIPRVAPILILAGDVGRVNQAHFVEYLHRLCQGFDQVLLVPGNHEYYQSSKPTHTLQETDEALFNINIPNLHVLQQKDVIINGVRFVGATLWTNPPDDLTGYIQNSLNDYKLIRMDKGSGTDVTKRDWKHITVDYTKQLHLQHLTYLQNVIQTSQEPIVVITHHCPTEKHINPKYKSEKNLNHAYFTDLPSTCPTLFNSPVIGWVCGHSHSATNFEQTFGNNKVLFLMNCKGYTHEYVEGYDPCRVASVYVDPTTHQHKLEELQQNLDEL